MGLVSQARRAGLTARYVVSAGATEDAEIAVVPGPGSAHHDLARILGVPLSASPPAEALAIHVLDPDEDPGPVAVAAAARAKAGDPVLVVVLGDRPTRQAGERTLLDHEPLEMSHIAHVARLVGSGQAAMAAIARAPDLDLAAAARRYPNLRAAFSRQVVRRSAALAGTMATGSLGGRAGMAALTVLQIRMVAELAAAYDRPLSPKKAADVAALIGGGFAFRLIGRGAAALVPFARFVARGGVAYAATWTLGELARRRLVAGHDLTGLSVDELRGAAARLRRSS